MGQTAMTQVILIPVKRLDAAKGRLAIALEPSDRRLLGLAMLADVLRATEKWSHRLVVTSDPDALAVGYAFECEIVPDRGLGLNQAILDGISRASHLDPESVLILPSDVPLVAADDVAAAFNDGADVVIAESADGGTNALRLRPPDAFEPRFGPRSAESHAEAASSAGLTTSILRHSSFELDVDLPADLERLARSGNERQSVVLARELLNRGWARTPDGTEPHGQRKDDE